METTEEEIWEIFQCSDWPVADADGRFPVKNPPPMRCAQFRNYTSGNLVIEEDKPVVSGFARLGYGYG